MKVQNVSVTEEMLASKNKRFSNYLIDLIPQYGIGFGVGAGSVYLGDQTGYYDLNQFLVGMSFLEDLIFNYSILLLYFIIFESLSFRSLGEYATNTKCIAARNRQPTIFSLEPCVD